MPVCSVINYLLPLGAVNDQMHYFTGPSIMCNSVSDRAQHQWVISWPIKHVNRHGRNDCSIT